MLRTLPIAAPIALLAVAGCDTEDAAFRSPDGEQPLVGDELTEPEARAALAEVDEVTRPDRADAEIIDITTDVTVGERFGSAVRRWRAFLESQAPCTEVSRDRNVVTVDFGTLDDDCAFAGRTYAGVDTITVTQIQDGADDDLRFHHELDGFTNGQISLTGEKSVYWTGESSQRVRADFTVLDLDTAESRDVTSRYTIGRLDPALPVVEGGFHLNGDRSWTDGTSGEWRLAMNHLAFFLDDPGPHDGSVVITNPIGRELTITYSSVDDDTIRAVVQGPRGDVIVFRITLAGDVVEDPS